jgi:hypothetical protein
MIVSFYDREFNALLNNASLLIDKNSYNLIKRPIELNDFSCVCEPFTEDIQPTFLVVKDDRGNSKELVYSALAGVPILNQYNKTEINATDLKTLFSSDVIIQYETYGNISQVINKIFTEWDNQVNKGSISCKIKFKDNAGATQLTNLVPATEKQVYNALDEISAYLNYYDLYIDSNIDLVAKEVVFTIGKIMQYDKNIKLWEYGIRNYGKWVADVNETQGYDTNFSEVNSIKWILTKDNKITITESERDIYPIKRRVFVNDDINEANKEALVELLNARYNENLEIPTNDNNIGFETKFNIYLKRGGELYKSLPCGELRYNSSGLYEVQIGFRYVGVDFI